MKWTDIPHGTITAAEQRLWVASGDAADAIATRINTDPEYLKWVVAYASRQKLLEFQYSLTTESIWRRFSVKEKLHEGYKIGTICGVPIASLSESFKEKFTTLVEWDVPVVKLNVHAILPAARDLPLEENPGIFPEIIGRHKIKFAHFLQLLRQTDFVHIFGYIDDANGILSGVFGSWGGEGWNLKALSIEFPIHQLSGMVVSR